MENVRLSKISRYKEMLREELASDIKLLLTAHLREFEENLANIDQLSVTSENGGGSRKAGH